jgi:hypothetical protein
VRAVVVRLNVWFATAAVRGLTALPFAPIVKGKWYQAVENCLEKKSGAP